MSWMDEYLTMIDDIEKRSDRLNDWEREFMESINDWIGQGLDLTPKQAEKISGIWDKATARG